MKMSDQKVPTNKDILSSRRDLRMMGYSLTSCLSLLKLGLSEYAEKTRFWVL